jgi:hypothetical protein
MLNNDTFNMAKARQWSDPQSALQAGRDYLTMAVEGVRGMEELNAEYDEARGQRRKRLMLDDEEFAARADDRALTGKHQDSLWNSTTQLGNNYMNLVGRLA